MLRKCLILIVAIIFLGSCTTGKSNLMTPSTTTISTSEATYGAESGITIIGTVMDISLSARIIALKEPVNGFNVVAITEESMLTSTDGSQITLRDIQPGMIVQVTGQPGASGALLASEVRVLDATTTPPSD